MDTRVTWNHVDIDVEETLRQCQDVGSDAVISAIDEETQLSLLMFACLSGNCGLTNILIRHGADVMYPGVLGAQALHCCALEGRVDMLPSDSNVMVTVKSLQNCLRLRQLKPRPQLYYAACADMLLWAGAEPLHKDENGVTAIDIAAQVPSKPREDPYRSETFLRMWCEKEGGKDYFLESYESPLSVACFRGFWSDAISLVEDGVDLFCGEPPQGETALSFALGDPYRGGCHDLVCALQGKGVNILADDFFSTAVVAGAAYETTKLFLDAGVDVNACGEIGTPLMLACEWRNDKIIELLLDSGADPSGLARRTDQYSTPITTARESRQVAMLIAAGADPVSDVARVKELNEGANRPTIEVWCPKYVDFYCNNAEARKTLQDWYLCRKKVRQAWLAVAIICRRAEGLDESSVHMAKDLLGDLMALPTEIIQNIKQQIIQSCLTQHNWASMPVHALP